MRSVFLIHHIIMLHIDTLKRTYHSQHTGDQKSTNEDVKHSMNLRIRLKRQRELLGLEGRERGRLLQWQELVRHSDMV